MLPTEKTPRKQQLNDLTVLVHAPPKFGKSSLFAQVEDALFLATEPGLNSLEVYQQPIHNWEEFLQAAKEIADGRHNFKTIVIDTADNAYRMCAQYVCQRKQVEHETDLEYGKGSALVNGEFYRVLNKLAMLPYGLFLISHCQEKEIETRTGKYTRVVPTLPQKASKLVLGLVDVILYGDFEVGSGPDGKPVHRRVWRTKPSTAYEAGDRTGRLPEVIDCSYAAFAAAFQTTGQPQPLAPVPTAAESVPATDAPASAPVRVAAPASAPKSPAPGAVTASRAPAVASAGTSTSTSTPAAKPRTSASSGR